MSIDGITTYSDFNKYILQSSATTATINNQNKKCCSHFSRDLILTLIRTRDTVISDYWIVSIGKEHNHKQSNY